MANWLNDAVVYEIYPQSFYDSNDDGIGDLEGIVKKLPYIKEMGFTAIWLNPVNESSFYDAGYDVIDFYKVAKRYGTNEDYKKLCDCAHEMGIKVIFDLVAGHTSIEHPWFKESSKAEENEYSNRYIWTTKTFERGPGVSSLGERDQKFISNFFITQPALNYGYAHPDPENPWELPVTHPDCVKMKEELKSIIKFWIELGTDAFRVDMAGTLIKGDADGAETKKLWSEVKEYINKINPEVLLIAEWGLPEKAIKAGFDLDFLLHSGPIAYRSLFRYEKGRNTTDDKTGHSYFCKDGKGNINDYLDRFLFDYENIKGKGYIGHITGNHDMQRLAYLRTKEEIKVCMAFIFTMPGVPFVYYGDEIGMDFIEGLPSKEGGYIRTGARTPMQWDVTKNHGFSKSDSPYLPTDKRENAPTVEKQINDENSLLSFVKRLIAFHKEENTLMAESEFNILHPGYPFVYERICKDEKLFIAINPSKYRYYYDVAEFSEVIFSQNTEFKNGQLIMDGISFIIARKS